MCIMSVAFSVVVWDNLLGDFQWRKDSLPWCRPHVTFPHAGDRPETEQAFECSLPGRNVRMLRLRDK